VEGAGEWGTAYLGLVSIKYIKIHNGHT
jgi:hypothetical protein